MKRLIRKSRINLPFDGNYDIKIGNTVAVYDDDYKGSEALVFWHINEFDEDYDIVITDFIAIKNDEDGVFEKDIDEYREDELKKIEKNFESYNYEHGDGNDWYLEDFERYLNQVSILLIY